MKRCSKCNNLMPDDALRCIRCEGESPSVVDQKSINTTEAKPVSGDDARSPRRINWTRFFAAVLTSKLFFVASCTGGMVLGLSGYEGVESDVHKGRPLDTRMSVIAVIPSANKTGERKVVQISLGSLEQFKQANSDYSFMPPLRKGEVNDPSLLDRQTAYTVTIDGPGKVVVETKLGIGEHHVLAKYEATDKEINPLYTKTSHDLVNALIGMSFGLPLAFVLALAGYIFKWRLERTVQRPPIPARPLFVRLGLFGLESRLIGLTCMWSCIAVALGLVFLKVWFGLIFLVPAWWYWYAIKWVDRNEIRKR